ncbi:MAG: tape measure protein [Dechloromonas sp.]|jgi:tape measure domain-containing protein|nr:tape measure protein [Dechloromonas sp.]
MSNKTVEVGLKITGDAKSGVAAADATSTALGNIDPAAKRAGQAVKSLDAQMNKLGIRSADQINADILEVNQALLALARRADLTGDEFDRAFRAAQQRLAELKQEAASGGEALDGVGRRASNAAGLLGKLGLAVGGLELARQFIAVNAELENIERSFVAVTGSAEVASAEMDYARQVAERLGLEQVGVARSYASMMAATKGTAAEGEKTRAVFESVARAMSLAGKTSAETEGALLALQQMASKGVVSMEELRQQLGERLPGALTATADGLGITTAQLIKLVETGQMTADELFPALASGLNKLYNDASAETLTQEWNHFKNAVQSAYTTIGDAGAVELLKGALESMEAVVFGVSTGIVSLGKNIGVLMGALANGDIGVNGFSENAKQAFAEIEQEVRERTVRIAQHNQLVAAGLDDVGQKMLAQAKGQSQVTEAATGDWTRLNVAFGAVKESTAAATAQAIKMAEATKEEGAAAIETAEALGSEADRRRARADAAKADAQALAEVAERRREEAAAAAEHVARLVEEAEAAGGATAQQQQVIDGLTKLAELRTADAAAAGAQAEKSQMAAVRAQVEAAAYESARGALSKWSAEKEAQLAVDAAGIRLAIEQQRTIAAVAKEKGREREATEALAEIKHLEIKLAELTAKAKAAEAEAILAGVKARREELKRSGELTEEKAKELAAAEAAAEVKKIEADIAEETAKRLRELADATDFGRTSAQKAAKDYDKLAESLDGVAKSAGDADEKLRNAADARYQSPSAGIDFSGLAKGRGAKGDQITAVSEGAAKIYAEMIAEKSPSALITPMIQNAMMSKAVDAALIEVAKTATTEARQDTPSEKHSNPRSALQIPASSFRIDLSINGGKTTPVNVASKSDAEVFEGFLRELEGAAKRSFK